MIVLEGEISRQIIGLSRYIGERTAPTTTPFLHAVVINTRFIRIRISLAGKSSFPVQVLPSENRHRHDYEQNGYLGVLYRPSWL
jgi:hypothetical protein